MNTKRIVRFNVALVIDDVDLRIAAVGDELRQACAEIVERQEGLGFSVEQTYTERLECVVEKEATASS